jgi:hypothetical protein
VTIPIVEASPTEQTTVLVAPPLASTSVLPILAEEEPPEAAPVRWLTPARLAALVIGALVIVIVAISVSGSGGSLTVPPKPSYPSVSGQLGTDLRQLEGTLP